uniref:Uncharacterized protein n=1 Tax=Anguilla anguilla TaxID=7936 RepID=A0A0E9VDN7_ANGAN
MQKLIRFLKRVNGTPIDYLIRNKSQGY